MTEQKKPKPYTGLAKYIHDVVDATADCLRELRGCLDDLLEHADGFQDSAGRAVRSALRPGTGTGAGTGFGTAGDSAVEAGEAAAAVDAGQIADLRTAVVALAERLRAYEGSAGDVAPEAA